MEGYSTTRTSASVGCGVSFCARAAGGKQGLAGQWQGAGGSSA